MSSRVDTEDLVLNYDPEAPAERFRSTGIDAALLSAEQRLPSPVPWPADRKPTAAALTTEVSETDGLSRFNGYDAIVVTWTAAEAAALASLFTPGYLPSTWYEYRHGIADYIPLVTGSRAPFRDTQADMARYYHSLGLYFPCTISKARVLLFKSGLHLDYDGPAIPVRRLMTELAETIQPKLFITTGTGGGIGADVKLGDVVIAGVTKFDCTTQFKDEAFAKASFTTSPTPASSLPAITSSLTKVNAARLTGGRTEPKFFASRTDTIVTTDFFGFDDSTDHFGLQELGRVCDMGDAMVGLALQKFPDIRWYFIRNASDPQIPNPDGDISKAKEQAGQIYAQFGAFTTAASVIATWAIISETFLGA